MAHTGITTTTTTTTVLKPIYLNYKNYNIGTAAYLVKHTFQVPSRPVLAAGFRVLQVTTEKNELALIPLHLSQELTAKWVNRTLRYIIYIYKYICSRRSSSDWSQAGRLSWDTVPPSRRDRRFADDLRAWVTGKRHSPTHVSITYRATRVFRRHRRISVRFVVIVAIPLYDYVYTSSMCDNNNIIIIIVLHEITIRFFNSIRVASVSFCLEILNHKPRLTGDDYITVVAFVSNVVYYIFIHPPIIVIN